MTAGSRGFASCSACGRHVRGGDAICPFCQSAIVEKVRTINDAPGPRASRAAILATAVSAAAIVAGCSDSSSAPPYGLPVLMDDAGLSADGGDGPASDGGSTEPTDGGTHVISPVYGAPAPTK